jgi:hypothetical protein
MSERERRVFFNVVQRSPGDFGDTANWVPKTIPVAGGKHPDAAGTLDHLAPSRDAHRHLQGGQLERAFGRTHKASILSGRPQAGSQCRKAWRGGRRTCVNRGKCGRIAVDHGLKEESGLVCVLAVVGRFLCLQVQPLVPAVKPCGKDSELWRGSRH